MSQPSARLLIETEVDAAVDARVVDVVGDLLNLLYWSVRPRPGFASVM